jgi:hypothetical protein
MPKSQKPVRKTLKDPYRQRPCRLCKAIFKPHTHVVACADSQEFCCPAHRKEYWKYGALPFDKLLVRIEKRCREIAREEIEAQNTVQVCRELIENLELQILELFARTEHLDLVATAAPALQASNVAR